MNSDRWTIPVNLIVSKIAKFGSFPASYFVGGGAFVESPPGGPEWKLRTGITILLPVKN